MQNAELITLMTAAVSIGFFHTLLGPDHYLPFVAMAKSGEWSGRKTLFVTAISGLGHVAGSVILGIFGIMLGIAVFKIEAFEAFRGSLAAWVLIGFGVLYIAWGIGRVGKHGHHSPGEDKKQNGSASVWALFLVFVLGPCEPLAPMLMYPAARGDWSSIFLVTAAFGLTTIATMLGAVLVSVQGLKFLPSFGWKKYTHIIAGSSVLLSGMAIKFLGI